MRDFVNWFLCFVAVHEGAVTAISTIAIALFTVVLAIVGGSQALLIGCQVRLARDEFRATHRPKITTGTCKIEIGDLVEAGQSLRCGFIYRNEGASPAYLREIGTRVFCGRYPWTTYPRIIHFHPVVAVKDIIESGQERMHWTPEPSFTINERDKEYWWFAGYMTYSDRKKGGTVRKVGFLRRWNDSPTALEWEKYDSEEYNYSY